MSDPTEREEPPADSAEPGGSPEPASAEARAGVDDAAVVDAAPAAAGGETFGEGLKRGALGLLKLVALVLPEALVAVIGAIVGLVVGLAAGATATADLLSAPGPWARAGPIALLLPVIVMLGPVLVGTLAGLLTPPPFVLLLHSGLLALFDYRDRYVTIWAATLGYWSPFVFALGGSLEAGMSSVILVGPFTGALGFMGAAAWLAARGILHERTLAQWWRDGDRSMIVTAALLTLLGSVILWFVCFLFLLLPISPLLLILSTVLCVRLLVVGRRRALAATLVGINTLHLAALVFAAVSWYRDTH